MKTKKLLMMVLVLAIMSGIFISFSSSTNLHADDNGVTFGIYNREAELHVLCQVKDNQTIKMYPEQVLISENWVADYKVSGKNKESVEVEIGGSRWYLKAVSAGKAKVQMLDPDNENIVIFNVEVIGSDAFDVIDEASKQIVLSSKTYLKQDKDGKINEYIKLTVNNGSSFSFKAAAISYNNKKAVPLYKTVKAGKTKTVKTVVQTFENADEAGSWNSLTKKQIKKLKAGKTISINNDISAYAVCYSNLYIGMVLE